MRGLTTNTKEARPHFSTTQPDPIQALLGHSDCDGFFEPWECLPIVERMLELVKGGGTFDDRDRRRAEQMAQSMRRAETAGERFLYLGALAALGLCPKQLPDAVASDRIAGFSRFPRPIARHGAA